MPSTFLVLSVSTFLVLSVSTFGVAGDTVFMTPRRHRTRPPARYRAGYRAPSGAGDDDASQRLPAPGSCLPVPVSSCRRRRSPPAPTASARHQRWRGGRAGGVYGPVGARESRRTERRLCPPPTTPATPSTPRLPDVGPTIPARRPPRPSQPTPLGTRKRATQSCNYAYCVGAAAPAGRSHVPDHVAWCRPVRGASAAGGPPPQGWHVCASSTVKVNEPDQAGTDAGGAAGPTGAGSWGPMLVTVRRT